MSWRWTDRVALGGFLATLVCFALFHVLPFRSDRWAGGKWQTYFGWEAWREWWSGITNLRQLSFAWPEALIWASLHLGVVMFLASPFLIGLLKSSRIVWWLVALMSASATVGITGILGWQVWTGFSPESETLESGFWLLVACPPLHFASLMFVRRRCRPPLA